MTTIDLSFVALFAHQSGRPYAITGTFDGVDLVNGGTHQAVDVGNFGMDDPILAVSSLGRGLFHFDGAIGYEDDLGDGWFLRRWHLNATLADGLELVLGRSDIGDWVDVEIGQVVGRTGNTGTRLPDGRPMPAHTHIVLTKDGVPYDVAPYLLGQPFETTGAAPSGGGDEPMYNPRDVLAIYGEQLVTKAGANVREKQGTSYAKLVTFPAGVQLSGTARVVGEPANGSIEWFETKVETEGQVRTAYVHTSAVDVIPAQPPAGGVPPADIAKIQEAAQEAGLIAGRDAAARAVCGGATVSIEPYLVLNRNEGTDTVHRNPREECNVDDAEGRQVIDGETADALLAMGDAVRCRHCYTEED